MKSTSIALFWDKIIDELSLTTTLGHPSLWTKKEIDSFNYSFIEKVISLCQVDERKAILCRIPKIHGEYQIESIGISYHTLRRILVKKESRGTPGLREMFAIYLGEESVHSFMVKHQILDFDEPNNIDRKNRNLLQYNTLHTTTTRLLIEHIEEESKEALSNNYSINTNRKGKLKEALDTDKLIEEMQKNHALLSEALSFLEISRGVKAIKDYNYSLAAAHFDKSISLNSLDERAYLGLAICHFEFQDYESMLSTLSSNAVNNNQRFKAVLQAIAYQNLDETNKAITLLNEKISELSKKDQILSIPLRITLGVINASCNKLEDALSIFRTIKTIIEISPFKKNDNQLHSCIFNLARIYELQGNHSKAKDLYQALLKSEYSVSRQSIVRLFYSKMLTRLKEDKAAIKVLSPNIKNLIQNPILSNSPIFVTSLYDTANLQLKNSDYKKAKKNYDKLWEIFSAIYGSNSLQTKLTENYIEFIKSKLES